MAAFADVYATYAAMVAVTGANDGQLAIVMGANGKSTTYVYRTAAAVGAANAGWYRPTAR
jgi:hypothetical protein